MKTRFFERCARSYSYLTNMCTQITNEYSNVTFSVIQCDPNFRNPLTIVNLLKNISDFYNENWLGNADYIHIPDAKKVLDNYLKYPIIMAYRKTSDDDIDILGVATLKYYQNTEKDVNPYYPIPNKKFFEVTGILTKQDSDIKNIGKKIYEILIEALEEYRKILPEFDVIFVADCRNYMSINGARGGARYLREQYNKEDYGKIIGFYTVRNQGKLVEAPTFVAKFEFENRIVSNDITFAFEVTDDLYEGMIETLRNSLAGNQIKPGVSTMDEEYNVTFYELEDDSINLDNITIIPNGTDKGNERIPWASTRKRIRIGGSNE